MRCAGGAVAAYAEMAADDAALRAHGPRALAGALLALHRPGAVAVSHSLHAGGAVAPERFTGALVVGYLLTTAAAVVVATAPYAAAILQRAC